MKSKQIRAACVDDFVMKTLSNSKKDGTKYKAPLKSCLEFMKRFNMLRSYVNENIVDQVLYVCRNAGFLISERDDEITSLDDLVTIDIEGRIIHDLTKQGKIKISLLNHDKYMFLLYRTNVIKYVTLDDGYEYVKFEDVYAMNIYVQRGYQSIFDIGHVDRIKSMKNLKNALKRDHVKCKKNKTESYARLNDLLKFVKEAYFKPHA